MRQRLLMDQNWRFALGHASNAAMDFGFTGSRDLVKAGEASGAASPKFEDTKWREVHLPHDWAVELPFDPRGDKQVCDHGFYAIGPDHPQHSVGWYRRRFNIPKGDLGKRLSIEFDGVFRDSIVWVNGHRMGRHQSGYTGFRYDITDIANYGGENVVVVRADASNWEGWFYEGAGIYRHVWLVKTSPLHVPQWGTYVTTDVKDSRAIVTIRTKVVNQSDEPAKFVLRSVCSPATSVGAASAAHRRSTGRLKPPLQGVTVDSEHQLAPWSEAEFAQTVELANPNLWSCDEPNLYKLHTALIVGKKRVDEYDTTFGVRTFRWDAKKGFFLNNKPLKIKGTCNHRDHAGVGVALPDRLHELRIEKLKELGCNAFRASHYPHAPELLDACDRLGLLVMAENRLAGSDPEILSQLESLILRDRNHPSIFLWSLANEEHTLQWSIAGERVGRTMVRHAHRLDPTRPVTTAMHDRGLGEGFANIVDVHGWNYIKVGDIEAFHKRRPEQPIVGSEEASTVCTRGVYADDPSRGYVSAYDLRAPGWGSTAEKWWTYFADREWLAGGFVWTGFDHRGEPIPYKWPCTLSHFGIMDLCGFPKDNYYYYQSWWTDKPVLHLFPHWNWKGREGQKIDVRVFSNCDEVELFVNDRSHGRKPIPRNSHAAWNVIYQPGILEAVGYKNNKRILSRRIETTDEPAQLLLTADRPIIRADGEDVASVTVSAVDAKGRFVPIADQLIHFEIEGSGQLIGVGNGDPSSHESEKAAHRKLFNGLALAILQAATKPGKLTLRATSEGLKPATLTIDVKRINRRGFVE